MPDTQEGYKIRAELIREITRQNYEPGNQSRNYRMVWRYHVYPRFGIGYRAYLRYLRHSDIIVKNKKE
jgi:hypothetical protein